MSDGVGDPRLRWYPPSWRIRYGDEFVALLEDQYADHLPASARLGLFTGGLRERGRQSGLTGDSVPEGDRIRAGALVVLIAWAAFVVAGANFAKFSEHFDEALPHAAGSHHVADLAFAVIQTVAFVAGIFVVAGALLAVPAFVRFVRAGGWPELRGHFLRALATTGITLVVTVPLLVTAHHLTSHQRNGGLHWYGALYLIWAALIVLTLTLWTVLIVAAAIRMQFSTLILAAEALLSVFVAIAMVVMVGATAIWWGAMANYAPTFLSGGPAGTVSSGWDLWLVVTVAAMALAMGIAALGAIREVRVWSKMRAG